MPISKDRRSGSPQNYIFFAVSITTVVSIGAGGGGGGVVVVVVVVDTVVSPVVASSWLALPQDDKLRATTAPSTNKLRSLMAITSVN